MILRFFSGRRRRRAFEEELARIRLDEVHAEAVAEDGDDFFRLTLAQQAVVDEDAGEVIARARCTSAAATALSTPPLIAHSTFFAREFFFEKGDLFGDEAGHRPVPFRAADGVEEVAQDLVTLLRVMHFGMELDAVDLAGGVFEGRRRGRSWSSP